jgi:hypothetical protein
VLIPRLKYKLQLHLTVHLKVILINKLKDMIIMELSNLHLLLITLFNLIIQSILFSLQQLELSINYKNSYIFNIILI